MVLLTSSRSHRALRWSRSFGRSATAVLVNDSASRSKKKDNIGTTITHERYGTDVTIEPTIDPNMGSDDLANSPRCSDRYSRHWIGNFTCRIQVLVPFTRLLAASEPDLMYASQFCRSSANWSVN